MASNPLGPLLRLSGVPSTALPPATASPQDLTPFLTSLLSEAIPFIDSISPKHPPKVNAMVEPPKNPWSLRSTKSYPTDSDAQVELLDRTIPAAELERIGRRFSRSAASGDWGRSVGGFDGFAFFGHQNTGEDGGERYDPASGVPPPSSNSTAPKTIKHPETWLTRRSVHAAIAETGTANYPEFRTAFRDQHSETELATTPDVVAIRDAIVYHHAPQIKRIWVPEDEAGAGGEWKVMSMKVVESRHHVGKPLEDRCFAGLQIVVQALETSPTSGTNGAGDDEDGAGWMGGDVGATDGRRERERAAEEEEEREEAREKKEFIIIHLSLRAFSSHPKAELCKSKSVVNAFFTSVERVRFIPPPSTSPTATSLTPGVGQIEWLLTLSTQPRGILPPWSWLQTLTIPRQISRDVPLFLGWIAQQRQTPPDDPFADPHNNATSTSPGGSNSSPGARANRLTLSPSNGNANGTSRENKRHTFVGPKTEKRREKEGREREKMREREARKSLALERKMYGTRDRNSSALGLGGSGGGGSVLDFMRRRSMDGNRRGEGVEQVEEDIPEVPKLVMVDSHRQQQQQGMVVGAAA